jgi:GNAT superfamily N-acetyltransferase
VKRITTRDGAEVVVRPIKPGDKNLLRRGFEHLSEESRYRRFLAPIRELTERDLRYLTEVDHRDHEALVALTPGGDPVGVARYIRLADRPQAAEVAVTVVDEWQGRGVGSALLERIARRARAVGIETLVGVCLATNEQMIELLGQLGGSRTRSHREGPLIEVEVELPASGDRATARRVVSAVARAATGGPAGGSA